MLCFIGVRHLVDAEPDPDWILRPDTLQGLQILAARSLTFDCVGILPRHLEHGPVFARRVPDLRILIDHLGKPAKLRPTIWTRGTLCLHVLPKCRMSLQRSRALMRAGPIAGL